MCIDLRTVEVRHSRYATEGRPGLRLQVPCHRCWQCTRDRRKCWVGKCIAESKTSTHVDVLTLTYCDVMSPIAHKFREPVSVEDTRSLNYDHVQRYFKRVRKAGYKFRYVIAGEYGEKKGRTHWHAIVFWQGEPYRPGLKAPGNPHGINPKDSKAWNDKFWPHGYVHYGDFNIKSAQYVCYYVTKSVNEAKEKGRMTSFNYSTKPGIGWKWLSDTWVQHYINQGLAPRDGKYYFDLPTGRFDFKMSPYSQVKFVREFDRRWYEQLGSHPPASAWCEKILDSVAERPVDTKLRQTQHRKIPEMPLPGYETLPRPQWPKVYLDDTLNAYWSEYPWLPGLRFFWSFNERGERAWANSLCSESEALRRRLSFAMNSSSDVHASETMSRAASRTGPAFPGRPPRPQPWSGVAGTLSTGPGSPTATLPH